MSYDDVVGEINGLERAMEKHLLQQNQVLHAMLQQFVKLREEVSELKKVVALIEDDPQNEKYVALKEAYDKYMFVRKMTLGE